MKTSNIATALPQKGDVIEVVVRGRVCAVQAEGVDEPIVYFEHDGDDGYAPPVYLNNRVQALTVITPAKPRLNLDDLPIGTVLEGLDSGETAGIYRRITDDWDWDEPQTARCWAALNGRRYTSAELDKRHDELVELVRKEATA